jgi:hypothetical protein
MAIPMADLVTIGSDRVLHDNADVLGEGGGHDSIAMCQRTIVPATQYEYRLSHQTWPQWRPLRQERYR